MRSGAKSYLLVRNGKFLTNTWADEIVGKRTEDTNPNSPIPNAARPLSPQFAREHFTNNLISSKLSLQLLSSVVVTPVRKSSS